MRAPSAKPDSNQIKSSATAGCPITLPCCAFDSEIARLQVRQMDREEELDVIRRAYAKQIMAEFGVADPRVEAAFAAVRREQFLGPGPWPILRWMRGYVTTPNADPVYLYTNHVIGILPERNLNN